MMRRANRPAIATIGRVGQRGAHVLIADWGLGLCAAQCRCHINPDTGQLAIDEDQTRGRLGLKSYPPGGTATTGPPCRCCSPWTWFELAMILQDLASIQALQTTPPATSTTS